jgi:hypothetical protein
VWGAGGMLYLIVEGVDALPGRRKLACYCRVLALYVVDAQVDRKEM